MRKLNVLFVYFVHGLGGENIDFIYVKLKLEEIFDKLFKCDENEGDVKNKIVTYCSSANSGMQSTYPLEKMFENDFNEFTNYFENNLIKSINRKKNKFNRFIGIECNIYVSITGHSLGGNVARGTITKIFQPYTKNDKTYDNFFEYIKEENNFVSKIIPCSYLSLSSPHLGANISEPNENTKFIKRIEKRMVKAFCNVIIGDVGKELTFQDEKVKHKVNKSEDNMKTEKSKYSLINCCNIESMEALANFPNRTLTAFLRYDLQVKYCSAMGCIETPLPKILENEKEILIKKNDSRIVMISGYNEGSELEFYQKELFNEKVSNKFYYSNTKIVASPDIDDQIKRALASKRERMNKINNENLLNNSSGKKNPKKKKSKSFFSFGKSLKKEKSGNIFSNNKTLKKEKSGNISSSNETLKEKSGNISSSNETLKEKSGNISSNDETLKDKSDNISSNDETLKDKSDNISSNDETLKDKSDNISSSNETIKNCNENSEIIISSSNIITEDEVETIEHYGNY